MKKTFFRTIIFLAVALIGAISASAASGTENGIGYSTNPDGKTVYITGYYGSEHDIVIPEKIAGYDVTAIGTKAFYNNTKITSIVLPDTVTEIRNSAFAGCEHLYEVTLSDHLRVLGFAAFADCYALHEIEIPTTVLEIGQCAFQDCENLDSVIIGMGVQKIGGSAFSNCYDLKEVTISDSVRGIGASAFEDCYSLERIEIPAGVIEIEEGVFEGCSSLYMVEVAEDNPNYANDTFAFYNKDRSVLLQYFCGTENTVYSIPESVKRIGDGAFSGSYKLERVNIPDSVTEIGDRAFKSSSITSVIIPNSALTLGKELFSYCYYLESAKLPSSITTIPALMFEFCPITSIDLPEGVTTIETCAFRHCEFIEVLTLPSTLEVIEPYAFEYCHRLLSINLPEGVKSIGDKAFADCPRVAGVYIPQSVSFIGNCAFGASSFEAVTMKTFDVDYRNPYYTSVDGVIFTEDMKTLVCYPAGKAYSKYIVPSSVTTIYPYAFSGGTRLEEVILPEGLLRIEEYAFWCSGIIYLTLPMSLEYIGDSAFYYNQRLVRVDIPAKDIALGNQTFLSCQPSEIWVYYGTKAASILRSDGFGSSLKYYFVLEHGETGITVDGSENAGICYRDILTVKTYTKNEIELYFADQLPEDAEEIIGYQILIYCQNSHQNVSPNEKIELSIPVVGDGNYRLYTYSNEGRLERADAKLEDGRFILETERVGDYIIVKMPDSTSGDSNGDGKIDTSDAVLLAQYLAGWQVSISEGAADCNGDGKTDTSDAVLLAQYIAGWQVTLG